MTDAEKRVQEIYEQGFCVIESLLSQDERAQVNRLMDAEWEKHGKPVLAAGGWGIHPLLTRIPEVAQYLAHPAAIETISLALRDDARVAHSGARISREDAAVEKENGNVALSMPWHFHYGWDLNTLPGRTKVERLLGLFYVDGTSRDLGPLVVYPRRYNEPVTQPSEDLMADWPGQINVEIPPGSIVIFDTALWHTARGGVQPATRHLFGAHYQGWSDMRPHGEDNVTVSPELERAMADMPDIKSLLVNPRST